MSGEISFVELGVDDVDRGRAFYEGLFAWKFETGPSGQGFTIAIPGVGGGIHGSDSGAPPMLFFRVDDLEAAAERVQELGGTVDELDITGDGDSTAQFGRFKMCRDDQGSPFGLHQPPAPI